MSCTHPIYALDFGKDPDTGKRRIKILPQRVEYNYFNLCDKYGKDCVICLPCGKCDSCIESRTRSWAARCVLEASLYETNSFLTLTYSNHCLPKFGLCKKDLQKFIKRLRRRYPDKEIRYFCCGEYGSKTKRPHYHLILFNWFPEDALPFAPGKFGGKLYTSKILQDLWPFGLSSVGDVSYASCGYVARYCQKKLKRDEQTYKEFCLMSLKPGIGERYFQTHFEDIYDTDKIYFNFGTSKSISPFRYFDKLFERIEPGKLEAIKKERISKANLSVAAELINHSFDELEKLNQYKEVAKAEKFKYLGRGGI